ncbi:MAG: LamG-like jellyroll fold domain-containing protein, partial [Planctomycetota bacterium]
SQGLVSRRSKVGTTVLDADTWYHVAAVLNGPTDMSLYVDGLEDGGTYSGTGGSLAYSSASSLIGVRHGGGYALSGKIDDVRVYERALSDEEIWEFYQTVHPPLIDVWPETLVFYANEGGSNPASQTISISNIGVGILNYRITEDCPWLEVDPNSGTSAGETDEVTVSVDISGLVWGEYSCELIISDPNAENSPRTVDVNLVVIGPVIEVSAEEFGFWGIEGGSNPNDQILGIRNGEGGTLKWTAAYDCNWLSVEPNNGILRGGEVNEVSLSVDTSGLTGGWYDCNLVVSDPNALNTPQLVGVKLGVRSASGLRVPSEYPTIQAAIDAAVYGDTVIVEPGIYTGTGNRDIDFLGKAITVRSVAPYDPYIVAATVVDCNGTEAEPHRGFYFHSGEDAKSVLDGLTITNGYVWGGGGIYAENDSDPMITNCTITGNSGSRGGGLYSSGGNLTLTNCTFIGNSADWGGGGMYIEGETGRATLIGCIFRGNQSTGDEHANGGGICSVGGEPGEEPGWELSITGCEISGNV